MSTANVTQTGQAATVAVTVSRGLQGATGAPGAPGTTDYNELDNVPSEFPPESHTHAVSDIVSISSHRLLGRHAGGSGAGQEVTVGNGLEFQGSGIRRSALTGDVTASAGSNSTTIANDAVTNAKLANVATATIKGRATAGTGDPEDLTPAQALEVIGAATPASVKVQIRKFAHIKPYRLALAGDSITGQNTAAVPATGASTFNGYSASGYGSIARSILGRRFELVHRAFSEDAGVGDWDFGIGGFSAVQYRDGSGGVFPMLDIQRVYQNIDGVFVFLGSNPAADITIDLDAITDIWDTLIAAGKEVFAAEVLPRSSASGSVVAARITSLNALLAPAAASRGIPFLTWYSDFADEDGYCSLDDMPDGVHPGARGAQKAGRLFASFIEPYISPDGFRAPDANSGAWLTTNPYMAGAGASTPTGWNFPVTATAQTVVLDNTGRWKRITNTQADYALPTYRQNSGTDKWKVGDRVRGVMRLRAATGIDMKAFTFRLIKLGGTTQTVFGMVYTVTSIAAEPSVLDGLDDMVFITPEFIVPADATSLFTYFSPAGSGTFDVQYCGVVHASYFD